MTPHHTPLSRLRDVPRWILPIVAGAILVLIISSHIYLWPVSYLGFAADPSSGMVYVVDPDSVADKAGLQANDQIVRMYNLTWLEASLHPNSLALAMPQIPITIQRGGQHYNFVLTQQPPSLTFQWVKGLNFMLALICWLTGYWIGVVRKHEFAHHTQVASVWLSSSLVIGWHQVALYGAPYLWLALIWFVIAMLTPLMIAIHAVFPLRPQSLARQHHHDRLVMGAWLGLNALIVGLIRWHDGAILPVIAVLNQVLPIAILCMVLGSAIVLYRGYRQTIIASVQRQIRLIGLAFLWVTLSFLLIFILPHVFNTYNMLANRLLDMVTIAIPLAYFINTLHGDFAWLDRLLLRLSVHAITLVILLWILAGIKYSFRLDGQGMTIWYGMYALLLYQPIMRVLVRSIPMFAAPSYQHLQQAQADFITTLDQDTLVAMMIGALKRTFGNFNYAWYSCTGGQPTRLQCIEHHGVDVPDQITDSAFIGYLQQQDLIVESQQIYADLPKIAVSHQTVTLVCLPSLVLWCPVRSSEGVLLGLLTLGMRDNLDPYRQHDLAYLRQFLTTTALALTNARAYHQQLVAEHMIRRLYQQVQRVQAQTAQQIARTLHDDVLNIYVRLNIQAIHGLLQDYPCGTLHDELALLLASEQGISQELRLVCEQLQPAGINDPFGLATSLRIHSQKMQAQWHGECLFVVEHQPLPLAIEVQRAVFHITKESIMNAIKHANASQILVSLRYPIGYDSHVEVRIQDNGTNAPQSIQPHPGHFGIQNMRESATMINASLNFVCSPTGTTVVLRFPASDQDAWYADHVWSISYEQASTDPAVARSLSALSSIDRWDSLSWLGSNRPANAR